MDMPLGKEGIMRVRGTPRLALGVMLPCLLAAPASAQLPQFEIPFDKFNQYENHLSLAGAAHYQQVRDSSEQVIGAYLELCQENDSSSNLIGSGYWNSSIDFTQGFDTAFQSTSYSQRGFALVIRSTTEARAVNTPGGALGYNGFKHSVAVVFDDHNAR